MNEYDKAALRTGLSMAGMAFGAPAGFNASLPVAAAVSAIPIFGWIAAPVILIAGTIGGGVAGAHFPGAALGHHIPTPR